MFEVVYTVTNYYDGPRAGVALVDGIPHYFESQWKDIDSSDNDIFLIQPVTPEILELALEDWAIWKRWETAFHKGETSKETHPALPDELGRHKQLEQILNEALEINPNISIKARADFKVDRARPVEYGMKNLIVEWDILG